VIDFNRRDLRKAYSRRWKKNKNLAGRITVKFGINENGDVVYADIIESTMNDPVFEETIIKNVKFWKFGQIYNPGDITEIVYPFTFSQ
jgi:TonB family protein